MKNLNFLNLAFLTTMFFGPSAHADLWTEGVNDATLQVKQEGETQILPKYQYTEIKTKFKYDDKTYRGTYLFNDYGASLIHGVSDNISIGGGFFVREVRDSVDHNTASPIDPELFIRAKSVLTRDLKLFYGAKLSVSPEASNEKNNFSGGPSAKASLGAKNYIFGPHALVGYATAELMGERKTQDEFGTATSNNSHILQLHAGYEHQLNSHQLGATIGALKILKGEEVDTAGRKTENFESDYFVANFYGSFHVNQQLNVIPSFRYLNALDIDDDDTVHFFSGAISLGFIF